MTDAAPLPKESSETDAIAKAAKDLLDLADISSSPFLEQEGMKERQNLLMWSAIGLGVATSIVVLPENKEQMQKLLEKATGLPIEIKPENILLVIVALATYYFVSFIVKLYRRWQKGRAYNSILNYRFISVSKELLERSKIVSFDLQNILRESQEDLNNNQAAANLKEHRKDLRNRLERVIESTFKAWEAEPDRPYKPNNDSSSGKPTRTSFLRVKSSPALRLKFATRKEIDKADLLSLEERKMIADSVEDVVDKWYTDSRIIERWTLIDEIANAIDRFNDPITPEKKNSQDESPIAIALRKREAVEELLLKQRIAGTQIDHLFNAIRHARHAIIVSTGIGWLWECMFPTALYLAFAGAVFHPWKWLGF